MTSWSPAPLGHFQTRCLDSRISGSVQRSRDTVRTPGFWSPRSRVRRGRGTAASTLHHHSPAVAIGHLWFLLITALLGSPGRELGSSAIGSRGLGIHKKHVTHTPPKTVIFEGPLQPNGRSRLKPDRVLWVWSGAKHVLQVGTLGGRLRGSALIAGDCAARL